MHKKTNTRNKENIFYLIGTEFLKSGIVQQLASRGWHSVNKQEQLLTGGGREGERRQS